MRLALIEWDDPGYVGEHWENREPFTEKSIPCITVGVVLHESKRDIQVVMNLNDAYYSQGITIPKSCIKRIRYLKVK